MDKNLSDISLSVINLYEELVDYLVDNNKIKVSRKHYGKTTKIGDKIRKSNRSNIRFSEFIKYFDFVLRKRFPEELLHNYEDNIENFRIYSTCFQLGDFFKKKNKYAGRYNVNNNTIVINIKDEEIFYSIYHELFHMASTNRMITDRMQTGFFEYKNGLATGKGLNEGYTDYLANRYFADVGFRIGYPLEIKYVGALEQIVGQEKMENLYITSNPGGLVNELEKYDTTSNIIHFVRLLDYASNSNDSIVVINQRFHEMTRYLIKWYLRKTILNGENLFDPTVRRNVIAFAWQMPSKISIPNSETIELNISEIIDEEVSEVLKNNSSMNLRF